MCADLVMSISEAFFPHRAIQNDCSRVYTMSFSANKINPGFIRNLFIHIFSNGCWYSSQSAMFSPSDTNTKETHCLYSGRGLMSVSSSVRTTRWILPLSWPHLLWYICVRSFIIIHEAGMCRGCEREGGVSVCDWEPQRVGERPWVWVCVWGSKGEGGRQVGGWHRNGCCCCCYCCDHILHTHTHARTTPLWCAVPCSADRVW